MTIRNVVLVHGAFADGSGWRGVYEHLTADGYRVAVVQNSTLSLAGDVAATHQALDGLDGPRYWLATPTAAPSSRRPATTPRSPRSLTSRRSCPMRASRSER